MAAARARKARRVGSERSQLMLVPAPPLPPVKGVELKTISRLTMLFAVVCLCAFLAGRPPAAADRIEKTFAPVSMQRAGTHKSSHGAALRHQKRVARSKVRAIDYGTMMRGAS